MTRREVLAWLETRRPVPPDALRARLAAAVSDADVWKPSAKRFRLPLRDGSERRPFVGPDLIVGLGRSFRPGAQDNSVEDRLP